MEQKPSALPAPVIKPSSPKEDEKKSLLDEVIAAINEKFKGDFTEADRVIIGDLYQRLLKDDKLRKLAKTSDMQIFLKNLFPAIFLETAQKAYMESTERYTRMFEDQSKFDAIRDELARVILRKMRNGK